MCSGRATDIGRLVAAIVYPPAAPAVYGEQAGQAAGAPPGVGGLVGGAISAGPAFSTTAQTTETVFPEPEPQQQSPLDIARASLEAQKQAKLGETRATIGKTQANEAARGLGGASPDYLAGVVGRQGGISYDDALQLVQEFLAGRGAG